MATIKTFRTTGPLAYSDIDDNFDNLNNEKIERVVSVNDSTPAIQITQTGAGESLVINTTEFVVDEDGKVGIGTNSPVTSLDLSAKTDGIAIPSGATVDRPAVTTATLRHNITTGQPEYYNPSSSAWGALGGGIPNMQVFTSSGNFTVPAGISRIKVTVVGGGGNGGNGSAGANPGGGGGAGGAAIKIITGLSSGSIIPVTVGSATQSSSFSTYCSASAGTSGSGLTPGSGGIGSGGDLNIKGGSATTSSTTGYGGVGGSSILGGGGQGGISSTLAQAGGSYGGGGGGGAGTNGYLVGGAGASGVVIVEW